MDINRYRLIDEELDSLTPSEIFNGWHFCPDWDEMLINRFSWDEGKSCTCELYKTH